jgi:hypothetical protein
VEAGSRVSGGGAGGGGFDFYGGVLVAWLHDTYVAPIVGLRGVVDFALNTHDDEV